MSLITTFTATLLIMSVWLVSALVAVPTIGFWEIGVFRLFLFQMISVMLVLAYFAIFTVINMLSSNKALPILISVLLFLGLLISASVIYNSFSEPETNSGVLLTQGGLEMAEPFPSSNYFTRVKRDVYSFIVDFLPTGREFDFGIRKLQIRSVCLFYPYLLHYCNCNSRWTACFQKEKLKVGKYA